MPGGWGRAMTVMRQPRLTELVSSRICHDLISPLGAVSNGLELLQMREGASSPELELALQAIAAANARVRFCRICFGVSGNEAQIARSEVVGILNDHFAESRINIVWESERSVARASAQLAFLAIMCLERALPQGGLIEVVQNGRGWIWQGRGPALRPSPGEWAVLEGQPLAAPTPATVSFVLLHELTRWHRPGLSVEMGDDGIRLCL